jgi:hypothetical protein
MASSGWSTSVLPPEADIRQRIEHVGLVPKEDIQPDKIQNRGWLEPSYVTDLA